GGRGTSLPWDSPAELDRLVDYCAWVLLHGMLPEIATAEDPWVNANRFDPGRAKWDLAGFFKMVVEARLLDIFEKEYTHQVDGKRVPKVATSLDQEREDEEGYIYSIGDMIPASSNMEEEVEAILESEARTRALNKVRTQMSPADRELWDRLLQLQESQRVNLSQFARALGKNRKTLRRFMDRVRPLLEKEGVSELL
ncbi:MAG: hypothetical protein O7E55_03095, partial [Chloroflexi bacterium]|nr:hypothetical protein [Chloroflexota bacterium]